MKHRLILLLSLLCTSASYGQQGTLSLKACIETGIRNNLTLKNTRVNVLKSQTALTQSRSRLLPVLAADFQMMDYLMKPANVTTGTLLDTDFADEPTWQKIQSMQYTMSAGINLSVPLYNQTILSANQVAQTIQNLSNVSYEKAVEDLTVQISNVYYLAQASLEQQRLLDENIQRMDSLCLITEELYKGGVVLEVDLTRVQINRKSLTAQRDQYATLHEQQINLLRFLLDLAPDVPLAVLPMPADVSPNPTPGVSSSLPELRLLSTRQELIEKQIKAVRAGYLPSLSLAGRLGAIGYQEEFRHNLEVFHTQQDNYRQAEDVYSVTEEKYKEGIASMTEMLQDEMRLRNAQAACVQAHCQCNVAQLTLLKLSGRLDELSQ